MNVKSDKIKVCGDIMRAYARVSNFSDLGGMMPPQISDWKATQDTCSFTVSGMPVCMRISQRVEPTLVVISSEEGSPFGFSLSFHFEPTGEPTGGATGDAAAFSSYVEAEVGINAIMGAMIKGQLQRAVTTLNEQIKRFAEL